MRQKSSATRLFRISDVWVKEKREQCQYLSTYAPTPPLADRTTIDWKQLRINVGLREGQVRSCSNQFFFLATVISMLFFIVVLIISAGRVCVIQGEREGRERGLKKKIDWWRACKISMTQNRCSVFKEILFPFLNPLGPRTTAEFAVIRHEKDFFLSKMELK